MPARPPIQDDLYREAAETYGAALERLARAYEADAEVRRDLLQEIHIALWQSFEGFDGRCSLRTWVYRVAHNTAISHVVLQRRRKRKRSWVWKNWRVSPTTAKAKGPRTVATPCSDS